MGGVARVCMMHRWVGGQGGWVSGWVERVMHWWVGGRWGREGGWVSLELSALGQERPRRQLSPARRRARSYKLTSQHPPPLPPALPLSPRQAGVWRVG